MLKIYQTVRHEWKGIPTHTKKKGWGVWKEKKKKKKKEVDSLKLGKFVLLDIVPVLA